MVSLQRAPWCSEASPKGPWKFSALRRLRGEGQDAAIAATGTLPMKRIDETLRLGKQVAELNAVVPGIVSRRVMQIDPTPASRTPG